MNSVEILHRFHVDFIKLLCSQPRICSTTSAGCLPLLRNDTLVSADLSLPSYRLCSSWNVSTVCEYSMAHKLLLVATYIHYTLRSLHKPLSAGDSKTTVSTYAAIIRYTTVALPKTIHSYVQYCYDDSTLSTTTN